MVSQFFTSPDAIDDQRDFSPTIRYFLEKSKGNVDLDSYEREAMNYIETVNPTCPPDLYFCQKASNETCQGGGIIPPYQQAKLLDYYEKEAEEYVKQLISENKEENSCKPK